MIRPSVALIGSFRQHLEEVRECARVFAAAGFTVKSPPLSRAIDENRRFVRFESDPPTSSDREIQAAALENIFSSDLVYVVNPGGYIGPATAYELGHVRERGMAVYYAEQPVDLPIEVPDGTVLATGGSLPHDNIPPYLVVNFVISLFGVFPSQN